MASATSFTMTRTGSLRFTPPTTGAPPTPTTASPAGVSARITRGRPGWSLSDETHYIYPGNSVIQERNSLNQTKVSYTRGFGLLARTDSTNGSLYYHTDGNDNVTALVNGQGTLVARYTYDPFGNLIGKHGSLADVNLYRFASQEVHPPSGLYAYTYRFYDPNLQRWINKDPIGFAGGRNPFAFVGNNPINNVDPLNEVCSE